MDLFLLFTLSAYLCYTAWVGRSIPESLSATYYMLGKRGWLFQVMMAFTAVILLPTWLDVTPDEWQFLPFLSCGSLLFVAVAPAFKLRLDGIVHYASAIVCGLSAVLWMFFQGYGDMFLYCFILALLFTLFCPKQYMFWLECGIVGAVLLAI